MTDKQIIINGVDVSGCECYNPNIKMDCLLYPLQSDACKNNPNCHYKLYKRKEQECEELKDKLNCCFCNPHVELNDIEKQRKCVEVTECFRRQLDQFKAENEYLKKQLESTKGLVTVGSKQLIEALKENEELNKVNDEKNELLAKLGCPTTATAKRKVLCLQQQIDKLKEDNEELRKDILIRCPNCGEEYLSSEGATYC